MVLVVPKNCGIHDHQPQQKHQHHYHHLPIPCSKPTDRGYKGEILISRTGLAGKVETSEI